MIEQSKHYALAITCGAKRGPKDTDLTFSPSSLRDFLKALAEQPALTVTYTCGVCGVSMQMEQPAQQEPVAWMWVVDGKPRNVTFGGANSNTPKDWTVLPLYTSPPANNQCKFPLCHNEDYQQALAEQIKRELYTGEPAQRTWVGLTDEDIKEAEWLLSAIKEHEAYTLQEQLLVEGVDVFTRAIEAKLKEKNA